jgi:hypothetical protein
MGIVDILDWTNAGGLLIPGLNQLDTGRIDSTLPHRHPDSVVPPQAAAGLSIPFAHAHGRCHDHMVPVFSVCLDPCKPPIRPWCGSSHIFNWESSIPLQSMIANSWRLPSHCKYYLDSSVPVTKSVSTCRLWETSVPLQLSWEASVPT